jgi:8-amino-7-oxononanoate synthase
MNDDARAIEAFAAAKLVELEDCGLRRELKPTGRGEGHLAVRDGRRLISFCDNDYLGLSRHPEVIAASVAATEKWGTGAGASRLVTGDNPLYAELETRLARIKGLPAARVFGSGYLANIGAIPVLTGPGDIVLIDELAHACMHAGARLSGAAVRTFPHNDVEALDRMLAEGSRSSRVLVLTETVFSMDGDQAPLGEISRVCSDRGAWLMTDDAHGFGVLEQNNPAPVQMGTLSKAVGAYGGYVAGPAAFVDLLTNRARSLVYTTGLPPGVLAAALAALDVMEREPGLGKRAQANARLFGSLIGCKGIESAIVPLVVGNAENALRASRKLEADGFLVTAIRPPTVPEGTARLRFTFSAAHEESEIRRLAAAVLALAPAEVEV